VPVSSEMRSIDFNSPLPFYHQLAEILREEIDKGTWGVDELIPPEGALTEIFGVSRSVTRKTLDLLEGEGRVLRIKGKGTLVTQPKSSYRAIEAAGAWFEQRSGDLRLGEVLESRRVPVGGHVGKLLEMSPRDDVWEIVLTHTLNRTVISMSHLYLRIYGTLSTGAPPEFEEGGPDMFRQLATRYGQELTDADIEIRVVLASKAEGEILGVVPGSSVVEVSSIESGKRTVGFIRTVFKPDNFRFNAALQRLPHAVRSDGLSAMVSSSS
jgi:GntR family transcriptional regulator